jgi:hypothetical protein
VYASPSTHPFSCFLQYTHLGQHIHSLPSSMYILG